MNHATNKRYRHHDMLTYKHPRNTIEAFGTDASNAYAGVRYKNRQLMLIKWLLRCLMMGWVMLMIVGVTR